MHDALSGMHSTIRNKIVEQDVLLRKRAIWRLKSQKVVFTNGVFDLIHPGHVDYLAKAAALGQKLVVGLNADVSVKTLNKGDDRPINPEMHRAAVLAALQAVDAVLLFEAPTPLALIEALNPDILVKGGDYDPACTDPKNERYIVGSDVVRLNGGEVAVVPFLEGFSSTRIVQKIRRHGQG